MGEQGGEERPMPLARYFLYVGGVLLALLFVSDAWLPKPALRVHADVFQPAILVYSDRNWPERVFYSTTRETISPGRTSSWVPYIPEPERLAGGTPKAREAFAALSPSDLWPVQQVRSKKAASSRTHGRQTVAGKAAPKVAMAQRPFNNRFVGMW